MPTGGGRRDEILATAAELFATSGLRTSLKEIADACGILPGSLYHHFESKDALIAELIERYHADLEALGAAALAGVAGDDRPLTDQLVDLGSTIAQCAVRHRAAFLFTIYEPPTSVGDQRARTAFLEVLRAGDRSGLVRPGVDLETMAERLYQVMLHSSLPVFGSAVSPDHVPAIRCRALLDGIAVAAPPDRTLDRSAPFAAAQRTIDSWVKAVDDEDPRLPELRAVARAEFGRRGYEATTVRDIAKAAGLSVGSVYRLIGSKDELLASIMGTFVAVARSGWTNVLRAEGTPIEKLDALTWLNINAVDRYTDEYNIQIAFLREAPPKGVNVGSTFTARLNEVKALLAQGARSGEVRLDGPSADVRAWALFELLWMPEGIVAALGPRGALALFRESTLRGISRPGRRRT